jgi:hypothetical protein
MTCIVSISFHVRSQGHREPLDCSLYRSLVTVKYDPKLHLRFDINQDCWSQDILAVFRKLSEDEYLRNEFGFDLVNEYVTVRANTCSLLSKGYVCCLARSPVSSPEQKWIMEGWF